MTKTQIFIEELSEMNRDVLVLPETGRRDVSLRCVAFSPKGTILAAGDDGGAVTIYSATPKGQQIIRLAHIGPILKVGFSADGRALATLATKHSNKPGKIRQGVTSLWVTKSWDQDAEPASSAAPAALQVPPREDRETGTMSERIVAHMTSGRQKRPSGER